MSVHFIRETLARQKEELLKELEGKKMEEYSGVELAQSPVREQIELARAYNLGIKDCIAIIKNLKGVE